LAAISRYEADMAFGLTALIVGGVGALAGAGASAYAANKAAGAQTAAANQSAALQKEIVGGVFKRLDRGATFRAALR
jgi:hypothetical protein